jgi:hypothetical protein
MGTLIIHAGMSKTGSSSIQRWLSDNVRWIQSQYGFRMLAVNIEDPDTPHVVVCPSGAVASHLGYEPLSSVGVAKLFDQLNCILGDQGVALMTSEAFSSWFYSGRAKVLPTLGTFALAHDVSIAYYVRPQHSALEAAWCQWGFREPFKPSEFLSRRLHSLHFTSTMRRVRDEAPGLSFTIRPFRRDLLNSGDVVTDFAKVFLGINDAVHLSGSTWENRGLPLELVNILRYAPSGQFWESPHDNRKLRQLRALGLGSWPTSGSPKAHRSRTVLQAFCHAEFEPENRQMIHDLRWPTDHFVPPPTDQSDVSADLMALDDLWEPDASDWERELLFHALATLLDRETISHEVGTSGRSQHSQDSRRLSSPSRSTPRMMWARLSETARQTVAARPYVAVAERGVAAGMPTRVVRRNGRTMIGTAWRGGRSRMTGWSALAWAGILRLMGGSSNRSTTCYGRPLVTPLTRQPRKTP